MLIGHLHQRLDAVLHHLFAVLVQERDQVALAHLHRAELGVEVTLLVAPGAPVGQDHVQDVIALDALVDDLHRRDTQALGEDLLASGL